jgi:hypothetical protein
MCVYVPPETPAGLPVFGCHLQARDVAVQQACEGAAAAAAATSEVARLRRALLDAELDTQRATTAAVAAQQRAVAAEAEVKTLRCAWSAVGDWKQHMSSAALPLLQSNAHLSRSISRSSSSALGTPCAVHSYCFCHHM